MEVLSLLNALIAYRVYVIYNVYICINLGGSMKIGCFDSEVVLISLLLFYVNNSRSFSASGCVTCCWIRLKFAISIFPLCSTEESLEVIVNNEQDSKK